MDDVILVADDDENVAKAIGRALRRPGREVLVAHRGADVLQCARQRRPGVIVLDIMMPAMDGIEVCRNIRANPQLARIRILFLTGKGRIADTIVGFESGGDDCLAKPFDQRELELRVKALLRRSEPRLEEKSAGRLEAGLLALDRRTFEVSTPTKTVLLSPVEFELLFFLMSSVGRVFSAEQLLREVWGYPPGTGTRDLVRVHIKNLRDKIEPEPRTPIYLRNIRRRGYMVADGSGPQGCQLKACPSA